MLVASLLGADMTVLAAAVMLGTFAGAVLGLLLWIETAELPEAPIPTIVAIERGGDLAVRSECAQAAS